MGVFLFEVVTNQLGGKQHTCEVYVLANNEEEALLRMHNVQDAVYIGIMVEAA